MILKTLLVQALLTLSLNVAFGAAETAVATAGADKAGGASGIGKFFNSPAGIIAVSGIATLYSKTLYDAAAEQEEASKENIKKIDKLIATYKDSWVGFCPKGRDNLNEPLCYCYLDSGKQNPNRTRSKTCIDLWAKHANKVLAEAGNYDDFSSGFIDPVGCLTLKGEFDENCKCKKFVDSKGNNACAKSANITIPGNSFGSSFLENSGLKDVLRLSANSANGNPRFDVFSAGQLNGRAIKSKAFLDSLTTKLVSENKGAANIPSVDKNNAEMVAKKVFGEEAIASAVKSSTSPIGIISTESRDKKTDDLLKAAAAKAGLENYGSGKGLNNKKTEAKEGMNFNFVGGETASAGAAQHFPEMEKNYNYKGSDISSNSETSIFEIISNRYINSGLKRLFDDDLEKK